jgi:hypothetical protein
MLYFNLAQNDQISRGIWKTFVIVNFYPNMKEQRYDVIWLNFFVFNKTWHQIWALHWKYKKIQNYALANKNP